MGAFAHAGSGDVPSVPDRADATTAAPFESAVVAMFNDHYPRLYRFLDRLTGDPDLASDLAQDAFVRLSRRGTMPDSPAAWLITVAMNLLRNARTSHARRRRLLTLSRGAAAHSDPAPPADATVLADEARVRVRAALDRLPERQQRLLLLRAEGYSYREIAFALALDEGSVGTLYARAQRAFRDFYGVTGNAPR